jgi:hypothetical protein
MQTMISMSLDRVPAALCLGLLLAGQAVAESKTDPMEMEVFGWVERVELLDGKFSMKAKLDSGAANSSLDATDIDRFEKDGERWVRFTVSDPENEEQITLEKPLERNVRIVRHGGEYQRRPVVKMTVCLGDKFREVEVNLIDRSNFIYPVLLGRSALEGYALIDSGRTFMFPPQCEDTDDR